MRFEATHSDPSLEVEPLGAKLHTSRYQQPRSSLRFGGTTLTFHNAILGLGTTRIKYHIHGCGSTHTSKRMKNQDAKITMSIDNRLHSEYS